jgi:hypothetical protein
MADIVTLTLELPYASLHLFILWSWRTDFSRKQWRIERICVAHASPTSDRQFGVDCPFLFFGLITRHSWGHSFVAPRSCLDLTQWTFTILASNRMLSQWIFEVAVPGAGTCCRWGSRDRDAIRMRPRRAWKWTCSFDNLGLSCWESPRPTAVCIRSPSSSRNVPPSPWIQRCRNKTLALELKIRSLVSFLSKFGFLKVAILNDGLFLVENPALLVKFPLDLVDFLVLTGLCALPWE